MALAVAQFTANGTWFSSGSKTVTGVNWAAGDWVIVFGAMESSSPRALTDPTATGLTFSKASTADPNSSAECEAGFWVAQAAASGSSVTVTQGVDGGTLNHGLAVWVISGGATSVTGITGSTTEANFSQTVAAGDAVIVALADWNATNPPGKTPATGSGTATERFDTSDGSSYSVWGADWVGTSAGTFSFGPNNYTSLKVAQVGVRVIAPVGGTDYTKTPADSVGATDAATVVRTSARTASDPAGVTDARTVARAVARTAADPVGVTDSATAITGRSATRADTVGITDAVSAAMARARAAADAVGVTDARTVARTSARTVTDPVAASDVVVAQLGQAVADTVAVTDAVSAVQTASRALADPIGVTDTTAGDLAGATLTLLNTFALSAADPHSITITGATAGLDVWLLVNTAATVATPAGWALEASRVAAMGSYAFHLPGGSNPGGSIAVTLDLSGARALSAVAIESATDDASVYASLVEPVNSNSTAYGTAAHTFTARDEALAVFMFHGTVALPPAAFDVVSFDQGFTELADTGWAGTGGSGDEAARIVIGHATAAAMSASGVVVTLDTAQPIGSAVGFVAFDLDTGLSGVKADPIGVTDTVVRTTASVRTQGDPIGLTDARTVTATAARTVANPVGVSDAVTAVLGQLIANPVGVTDARTVVRTSARTVANPVGITDSVSANLTSGGTNYTRTVADAVGVTDTGSPQTIDFGYTVADPAGVTDSAARALAAVRARNDAVGIVDSASSSLGGGGTNYSRTPADPVGITDARTVARTMPRSPADAVGVTDAAGRVLARARTQADAVGLADTVLVVRTTVRTVADPVGVTDAAFVPGAAPPWSWLVSTGATLVEHTPLLDGVHPATADVT